MQSQTPSLAELQDLLSSRTTEVQVIQAEVEKARAILASCDVRLAKLIGSPVQRETQKPLKTFIKNILNTTNEPLTVKEITELVLEAGYKTASTKNFRNIVQQALANDAEFKRKTRPKTRPARYTVEEV
jgi:hypothetical protein